MDDDSERSSSGSSSFYKIWKPLVHYDGFSSNKKTEPKFMTIFNTSWVWFEIKCSFFQHDEQGIV